MCNKAQLKNLLWECFFSLLAAKERLVSQYLKPNEMVNIQPIWLKILVVNASS